MNKKKKVIKHKKKSVRLSYPEDNTALLNFDDQKVQVRYEKANKKYLTLEMPYQDFDSLEELVKRLLDKHPRYSK